MKIIVKTSGKPDQVVEVSPDTEIVEIQLDRKGDPWSKEEDGRLRTQWSAIVNEQIKSLATDHQRSDGAISSRLVRLGLLPRNGEFRY
jgi:hypothetical protein